MAITISHMGYIKRTHISEYRNQNRGKGHKGSDIRDNDFVEHLFVASMHNYMLFLLKKAKFIGEYMISLKAQELQKEDQYKT